MKNKPFYKKSTFWLVVTPLALLLIFFWPYLTFLFKKYIYLPPANPAPEEFFVLPGSTETEFKGLNPLTEEVVEVTKDEEAGVTHVVHHRDGYSLELPSYLSVSSWDFTPEELQIYDLRDENSLCVSSIYRIEDYKAINEAFDADLASKKQQEKNGAYSILRMELEEIKDSEIKNEAYIEHFEEDVFGYQPGIYIQGDQVVFWISQNGKDYPECSLMMEVLRSFTIDS